MAHRGWIGVDLDATLAHYDGWKGEHHIGEPIGPMLDLVKSWTEKGQEVRIFTARVCNGDPQGCTGFIQAWCKKHIGVELAVTCQKDYDMIELWDDRAVQVIPNTGCRVGSTVYRR